MLGWAMTAVLAALAILIAVDELSRYLPIVGIVAIMLAFSARMNEEYLYSGLGYTVAGSICIGVAFKLDVSTGLAVGAVGISLFLLAYRSLTLEELQRNRMMRD